MLFLSPVKINKEPPRIDWRPKKIERHIEKVLPVIIYFLDSDVVQSMTSKAYITKKIMVKQGIEL